MMKQQCILIVMIILKYYTLIDIDETAQWIQYCQNDREFCPRCFGSGHGIQLQNINSLSVDLGTSINNLFGSRTIQLADWKADDVHLPVVLKYLSNLDGQNRVKSALCQAIKDDKLDIHLDCDSLWKMFTSNQDKRLPLIELLEHVFITNQWTDGITFCPVHSNSTEFIRTFNQFPNEATFWMQLLVNPELVALQTFHNSMQLKRFVPKVLDWCGFVIIEEFAGTALYEYYDHPLKVRIALAKQLLEAAVSFSHGINGFR